MVRGIIENDYLEEDTKRAAIPVILNSQHMKTKTKGSTITTNTKKMHTWNMTFPRVEQEEGRGHREASRSPLAVSLW